MATWSRSKRTMDIHEWHVPNGCWNQLQQALSDATRTLAEMKGKDVSDLYDNEVLFKAVDDGVVIYFEREKVTGGWGGDYTGWGERED